MENKAPVYDICTLSPTADNDILISRFAPYLARHKNLSAAHRHSFYHLVLFTKGAGTHTIDFERFDVKPGQIYSMAPGQVHSWAFEGDIDGYVINFSARFFQSFFLNQAYIESFPFFRGDAAVSVVNLCEETYQKIKTLFEEIVSETEHRDVFNADMARLLMMQVFIIINRASGLTVASEALSYNETLVRNFQRLVDEHYTRLKLPRDYAALLYITPNHLNAVCQDVLGFSAGEVVRNRLLLEAKRLLTNPKMNINEIALTLNFSDNSYFTKFFKKAENRTPEEFRKEILNTKQS